MGSFVATRLPIIARQLHSEPLPVWRLVTNSGSDESAQCSHAPHLNRESVSTWQQSWRARRSTRTPRAGGLRFDDRAHVQARIQKKVSDAEPS